MSFSPLPQSQCDTWFCLHQGTYSYRSGGVLILQENCSNLPITKVWKQLQNVLMHYFPPSSSPTKLYQRELIETKPWRWTPLLLSTGETNLVQQLPAALAIPMPEQKGHQTLLISIAKMVPGTYWEPAARAQLVHSGGRDSGLNTVLRTKCVLQQFCSLVKRYPISSCTIRAFRIHWAQTQLWNYSTGL